MTGAWRQFRSFDTPVRLLLANQLTINLGFYMLMPYLAAHLSDGLGMAAWTVGLVLGVRNLSQQGMFLVGGALADRFGYKPLIVAGCALRTAGFALLGFVDSLPALLAASAATGLAGALFNPAVRAYLAADAGERRVEAFALFNVFYQAGILLGPLLGVALTAVAFQLTCTVSAVLFAALTVVQVRHLPDRRGEVEGERPALRAQGRQVMTNRPFWLFAAAMVGSYVLSFQIYLALPMEIGRLTGGGTTGTVATSALFAVSALVTLVGQVRVTAWCTRRLRPDQCLMAGLGLMSLAFLPPLLTASRPPAGDAPAAVAAAAAPLLLCAALLAAGTAVLYPFEMDTVVALSGGRWVATHYGLYNTVAGVGITVGNLATGAALDASRAVGHPALPWLALVAVGAACTAAIASLGRSGRLAVPAARPEPAGA